MSQKNITIYDLAKEAGVSPATVSRILNGTTAVSPKKREAVMTLIHKYQFQPNALARALSEKRSRLIAMVVAHAENSYYNSLFAACESEAYRRGYVTVLLSTHSVPETEESVIRRMGELRPDAVILCGGRIDLAEPDPDFIRMLASLSERMRLVVGSQSPCPGIPGIAVDHEKSMELALSYLTSLGHREIGFVYTGAPYYGTVQRLTRFSAIMDAMHLPLHPEWLIEVPEYDIPSGVIGAERILALSHRPTAILGMNDMVSSGILQGLLAHGVQVPQDISLLGFDDTFVTRIAAPHLTSIGYDYPTYARLLLDAALYEGDPGEYPQNQIIPVYLKVRDSCRRLDV
ncbi:MAG: LacI family DNA-binding transcriptional regulator [Clostridia bacterium]|nr:LacI family DNA-binding transcriptional regulator [Clostridia bacterium]